MWCAHNGPGARRCNRSGYILPPRHNWADGKTAEILGDDIFKLPDGKLTTMYHYQKNMELMDEKVNKIDKPKMTEEIKA